MQWKEVCFIVVSLIESGGSFGFWGFWLLQRSVESGSRRSGLFDASNNTGHWILQRVRQYATVQAAATAKNDTTATTGRTAPIPPPSRVNVSPHGLSPPIVHRSVNGNLCWSISTEVDCLFSLRIYWVFFPCSTSFVFQQVIMVFRGRKQLILLEHPPTLSFVSERVIGFRVEQEGHRETIVFLQDVENAD
jgi:hypothetical protein